WGDGIEPYYGPWFELRYILPHPYAPQSIDLAFRLMNEPSSGIPEKEVLPEGFGLFQNVPNPFTSATSIRYNLPAGGGHVRLEIYDVTGRLVSTLVDDVREGGAHSVEWSGRNDAGRDLPAGIYFQRLSLDNQEISQKMLLMK
ncbi:MAG: FlgD immunoglobulin-like domain containing protein, partial [Dehalococcoidia bacterium]